MINGMHTFFLFVDKISIYNLISRDLIVDLKYEICYITKNSSEVMLEEKKN